jgi:hypothetical protein
MTSALTSYHESGHSTLSFLLGEMPEEVTIRPEGNSLGHTRYLSVESRAIAEAAVLGRTSSDRDRVTRFLITTAAGPCAQALYMRGSRTNFIDEKSWEIFDGADDYRKVERVLELAQRLLHVNMDAVVDEAYDLLEQPQVWSGVEQVAGDLLRFGELDYAGVRDAVTVNELIGIKPKRVSRAGESLRKAGWDESEIGTGRRVLTKEEAMKKIEAKSPVGLSRVGWNKEMERR